MASRAAPPRPGRRRGSRRPGRPRGRSRPRAAGLPAAIVTICATVVDGRSAEASMRARAAASVSGPTSISATTAPRDAQRAEHGVEIQPRRELAAGQDEQNRQAAEPPPGVGDELQAGQRPTGAGPRTPAATGPGRRPGHELHHGLAQLDPLELRIGARSRRRDRRLPLPGPAPGRSWPGPRPRAPTPAAGRSGCTRSLSTSVQMANGASRPGPAAVVPAIKVASGAARRAAPCSSSTSLVLPMPPSPSSSTAPPVPFRAACQALTSSAKSRSRPMRPADRLDRRARPARAPR